MPVSFVSTSQRESYGRYVGGSLTVTVLSVPLLPKPHHQHALHASIRSVSSRTRKPSVGTDRLSGCSTVHF
jgi:hypothetical protein